jgi:hypothetical protein
MEKLQNSMNSISSQPYKTVLSTANSTGGIKFYLLTMKQICNSCLQILKRRHLFVAYLMTLSVFRITCHMIQRLAINYKDVKRSGHGSILCHNLHGQTVENHKNSVFNQDLPNKRTKLLSTQPSPFTRRR